MLPAPRQTTSTQAPITREFTLEGMSAVPGGTTPATILGSITITEDIPAGSTINVEARIAGTSQFSTVIQNLPAKSNQTFSYTKATSNTWYDLKVTLLDPASKAIGTSQILTVSAPSLNVQFTLRAATPSVTPSPTPQPTQSAPQSSTTSSPLQPTPTPTTTASGTALSGLISFHGVTPVNSRIVILQRLANASTYQVAVDNVLPVDATAWQWNSATASSSYTVLAVLKYKNTDGSDSDFAYSSPVTVTAPATSIQFTINSNYTLAKPSAVSWVSCTTYNSGPNQNSWNVTVNFPVFSGALSYWLQLGTTDGGTDMANTYGEGRTVSAVFKNNTTYFARYAYSAVSGADPGSGQYSVFSDTTRLICSK